MRKGCVSVPLLFSPSVNNLVTVRVVKLKGETW